MAGKKDVKIVKTAKRGTELVLPGTQTVIYQSNRITQGRFEFSLMQMKLFVSVIKGLQEPIIHNMSGKDYMQLSIFSEQPDSPIVTIPILLKELVTPSHYKEIHAAAVDLMDIKIKLKNIKEKDYITISNLFTAVSLPSKANKGGTMIYVEMYKTTAQQLIDIDRNLAGKPAHYTKYLFEVVANANCKYTPLLYQKISSWKSKGGFRIKLEDLRFDLGLTENEYPAFSDFKRRVLKPVQEDLERKADCWFNADADDFAEREGKKVVFLNFKVITPEIEDTYKVKAESFKHLLMTHYRCTQEQVNQLDPIFRGEFDYAALVEKFQQVKEHIENNRVSINDRQQYMIRSLLNEFAA